MKANRKVTSVSAASQSLKWKLRAAIGLALGVSLASQGVNASTVTWNENGGLLNLSSWSGGFLGGIVNGILDLSPTIDASTNLVFANASSNRLTPTGVPNNLTLNSILFGGNINTGAYTIGNSSSTFKIGGGGVENKDNLVQNLGAKFLLSNSTTFNAVSGGLNFTGAINLNNALSGSSTKTLTLNGDHDISISGAISNSGSINNVGEVTKTGLGTTTLSGNNSYTGATNIDGGTLALGANERLANTGTVNVNNGGTFDVKAKTETIGKLDLKSGGAIKGGGTLGALIVGTDYTNAGFGTGNLFNKSAGVTDTKINSSAISAATQQTLTVGTGTANDGITASTMAFGNLHVGTSAEQTYTIGNAGNTGSSSLRGAVQNLGSHDSQLTGNGTTEAGYNWGDDAAIAAGTNIGPKIVKFTATTAGALFEKLTVVNNFANTLHQTLEIHGAAYDYAKMNPISPVTLANQRIGGTATQALSVTNGATNHEYSEKLDASISANSPIIASGSAIHGLAAGATNNTNFTVGVNTATAGNKSGIATIALVSSGTDTSELGDTDLHSQDVNVSGNVYRTASGSTAATVNLAAQHVGGSASKTLVVSNNVVNDGYSEKLDASFGAATGGISTSGVAGLIVAGGNSNAMSVGIDTTTAGAKSGNVGVNFSSNGTGTSGLATISNGSQNVIVSGDVYNYANVGLQHVSGGSTWDDKSLTLDFGSFTQGSGTQTATFSLANIGGLDSLYTDLLDGNYNFSLDSAFSSSNVNNFTNLAGGSSLANLDFLFNTSTVGNYVGSVFLASTGHNISGYLGALDGMTINFKGSVSGVAAVPVPAAAWLFLTGMVGLLGLGRRNKAI